MWPLTPSPAPRPRLARLLPLFIILSLLAGPGRFAPDVAEAVSLTFTPTADAYVDAAAPSTNYGASSILRTVASPAQMSYLRFTVAGLSGAAITRATLRVYAN